MKINAIIEIPKGSNRRIHFVKDKNKFVDFGTIKEKISVNEGKMPIAYGFIKNTLNKKEGDEIDALILSNKNLKTGDEIEIFPIGLILREDGDDKIVATDETTKNIKKWNDVNKNERKLILDYFGFRHKIISVENSKEALNYIEKNLIRK